MRRHLRGSPGHLRRRVANTVPARMGRGRGAVLHGTEPTRRSGFHSEDGRGPSRGGRCRGGGDLVRPRRGRRHACPSRPIKSAIRVKPPRTGLPGEPARAFAAFHPRGCLPSRSCRPAREPGHLGSSWVIPTTLAPERVRAWRRDDKVRGAFCKVDELPLSRHRLPALRCCFSGRQAESASMDTSAWATADDVTGDVDHDFLGRNSSGDKTTTVTSRRQFAPHWWDPLRRNGRRGVNAPVTGAISARVRREWDTWRDGPLPLPTSCARAVESCCHAAAIKPHPTVTFLALFPIFIFIFFLAISPPQRVATSHFFEHHR